jgi:hypothetical protein
MNFYEGTGEASKFQGWMVTSILKKRRITTAVGTSNININSISSNNNTQDLEFVDGMIMIGKWMNRWRNDGGEMHFRQGGWGPSSSDRGSIDQGILSRRMIMLRRPKEDVGYVLIIRKCWW